MFKVAKLVSGRVISPIEIKNVKGQKPLIVTVTHYDGKQPKGPHVLGQPVRTPGFLARQTEPHAATRMD